jgi:hypothetical protein
MAGLALATGCWKAPAPAQPEVPARVEVLPGSAAVTVGRSLTFSARINGGPAGEVAWSVLEAAGGSVDGGGRYRAPARPGSFTLQAAWKGAPERVAQARVLVVAAPAGEIRVSPHVMAGATGHASIIPVAGSSYRWSATGALITAGADTPSATFEAGPGPSLKLLCRVVNAAGDALDSSLDVPMVPPVALAIKPATATVTAGRGFKFGFEISGGNTLAVLWSLGEPGTGAIDRDGRYLAPAVTGSYSVRVTAADDPAVFASAQVKVVAAPPAALFAPGSFLPGAQGLHASVPALEGMSYAWEIEGGTLVSGATGAELVFDAGAGPSLTVRCRIRNEAGDVQVSEKTMRTR